MNISHRIITFFIFQMLLQCVFSQEFTPIVKQYNKKDYGAANQNWAVGQGADGMMYFGNNNGLLQYDGSSWELHRMPQNKIVRSLLVSGDRIYVGSFEEFGFFQKDELGQLAYTSLSDSLKAYDMQNDEIWIILQLKDRVIFQSFTSYFEIKDNKVYGYRLPYTFLFFNQYRDKIYTHTEQIGFGIFDMQKRKPLPVQQNMFGSQVFSVLTFDPLHALVVTKSDGLFLFDGATFKPFKTAADAEIKRAEINRALITTDGIIVLGTILNGVTAIDQGPIVVMIENHRTGLPWQLFMQNDNVKSGLEKLGFTKE